MSGLGADIASHLDRGRALDLLATLVRTPSENPPGNEAEAAGIVAAYCNQLGLEVSSHEVEPGRPSVVARWGDGGPEVCYCSHIDVVPAGDRDLWGVDPFGAATRDGRLFGRGSADAKGPVAAALEAVNALMTSGFEPRGTLTLALVADEETMGLKGAGHLVETGVVAPRFAIVGEPTSLRVVRAQRGACWFRITTRGVAAHGSAPERGRNAIEHMAAIVARLNEKLPDIRHPLLGGATINVGTIRGGEKTNIVAASCTIEVDRRSIPGETRGSVQASVEAAIDDARRHFPDLDADVSLEFYSRPFEVPEDARIVAEVSGAVAETLGSPPELIGFRGASDARFLAEAGAEVVVLGPGDIASAHTADESIDIEEFHRAAHAYALAFARLLSD